jgi:hypothetical protein
MAITFETRASSPISLADYLDFLDSRVDVSDTDSVYEQSGVFAALLSNEHLIADCLNKELKLWRDFQRGNQYSAQTMLLGRTKNFVIRANIWTPPTSDPILRKHEDVFYSYKIPHDHNFSFMTGGYYGSGYETLIYEYDADALVGNPGEYAGLRFLERTRLPKGKVMFYRASQDVHSQEHPEEFSISVNLLLIRPLETIRTQYLFDIEQNVIREPAKNTLRAQQMLCELARYAGDDVTTSILDDLSICHPNAHVRATCLKTLSEIDASRSNDLYERAVRDKHPLVRERGMRAV